MLLVGKAVAGEIRKPKTEGRRKLEIRNPKNSNRSPGKPAGQKLRLAGPGGSGLRAHKAARVLVSSDFGLRTSDFGFDGRDAANSRASTVHRA